jgi:hypothetical protein
VKTNIIPCSCRCSGKFQIATTDLSHNKDDHGSGDEDKLIGDDSVIECNEDNHERSDEDMRSSASYVIHLLVKP